MPAQHPDSPLGTFLKALREEKIDCILIGAMAAVQQGAPLMTIDYDFWVRLPERQYVRLLAIVQRLGGTIRAQTLYELRDRTQMHSNVPVVVGVVDPSQTPAVEFTRAPNQPWIFPAMSLNGANSARVAHDGKGNFEVSVVLAGRR